MKKFLIGFLALSLLFIPAVSCSQPSPTVPSEVKSEDEARGVAISYIQANYEKTAPSPGGDWHGEDVTPEGLLGRRTIEFTLDEWEVLVSSPVVAPENIKYEVTVRNTESNWYWRGIVEPDGYVNELVPFQQVTQDKSRQIAEEFVRNSPTFAFDGIEDTLQLVETLYPDIENAWQFVFQFESRQAGYGNRTGQMLAEVITPHEAIITVEQGEVTNAVMDEKWDMINQQMLEDKEISWLRYTK